MEIKKIVVGIIIVLVIASSLLLAVTQKIQAQAQGDSLDISKKLDDILSNQKSILAGIDSMREELKIIKIRITQQQ